MRFRSIVAALAVAGLVTSACGGLTDPADNQLQTFSGTLHPGDAGLHSFTVAKNGEYSVKLVSLTPPLPQVNFCTGIWLVPVSAGNCQLGVFVGRNDCALAGQAQALPNGGSSIITTGQYCLVVTDEGFFSTDETYTVSVSHP